jgi:Glycosyl transferase family 2
VKVVMTLLARNEADIVDAQIAFHLHAGVDFVIATDNRSTDGTTEILERYQREGYVHLLREEAASMLQHVWVTRMARLAATEFAADWVLHSDADEFWWPRGGSLKDVLATVPERKGLIRGCWRHFVPRPDDSRPFFERMTVRLAVPAHPGDKRTIFHAHQKVAHRGDRYAWVERGNHNAYGERLEPFRGWHPIEVLHFSLRSPSQVERKVTGGWFRARDYDAPLHQVLASQAGAEGRVPSYYAGFMVDDEALARGLADGTLAVDTRLRDALRSLRTEDGGFALPREGRRLAFPRPDAVEDALYAAEASVLVGIDGVVRAEERIDRLDARLHQLEQGPVPRLLGAGERLRRLARR